MQGPFSISIIFEACKFQNAGYGLFLQIQTRWGKTQHILWKIDFVLEGNNSAKCSFPSKNVIIAVNQQILGLQDTTISILACLSFLVVHLLLVVHFTHAVQEKELPSPSSPPVSNTADALGMAANLHCFELHWKWKQLLSVRLYWYTNSWTNVASMKHAPAGSKIMLCFLCLFCASSHITCVQWGPMWVTVWPWSEWVTVSTLYWGVIQIFPRNRSNAHAMVVKSRNTRSKPQTVKSCKAAKWTRWLQRQHKLSQ